MSEIILQRICDPLVKGNASEKELQCKILPPIILGRGPILKCADKRISRNHATIDWDEDGILLTSTHTNPTFITRNGKESSLTKNNSIILYNGDKFGLLKEAFWFKLVINLEAKEDDECKSTKSNSANTAEPMEVDVDSKNKNVPEQDIPNSPPPLVSENSNKKLQELNSANVEESVNGRESNIHSCDAKLGDINITNVEEDKREEEDGLVHPPEKAFYKNERPRALPNWLQKISAKEKSDETSLPVRPKTKATKASVKAPPKRKPKQDLHAEEDTKESNGKGSPKKRFPSPTRASPNKATSKENSRQIPSPKKASPKKASPKKACPKKASPKKASPSKASPKKSFHSVSQDYDISDSDSDTSERRNLHFVSDDEAESSPEKAKAETSPSKAEATHQKDPRETSPDNSDVSTNAKLNQASPKKPYAAALAALKGPPSKPPSRPPCQYGAQCYRKNPAHRKTEAHPGDPDYISPNEESGDSDDERPECEFGLTCYRKNPQHRKTHKHTRKPQPQRLAKKNRKRQRNDSDDDYDLDDPFLNDDSSDDYAPTDTSGSDTDVGDAEAEDTHRMLKEGKKFVKKS